MYLSLPIRRGCEHVETRLTIEQTEPVCKSLSKELNVASVIRELLDEPSSTETPPSIASTYTSASPRSRATDGLVPTGAMHDELGHVLWPTSSVALPHDQVGDVPEMTTPSNVHLPVRSSSPLETGTGKAVDWNSIAGIAGIVAGLLVMCLLRIWLVKRTRTTREDEKVEGVRAPLLKDRWVNFGSFIQS